MKETITHKEYLTLLGLKEIADKNRNVFNECVDTFAGIIDEEEHYGYDWSFEYLWDDTVPSLKRWLKNREIEVTDG